MKNPFLDLDKRDLKLAQLRLLNELSNLRADSKSYRSRLQMTRSELARVEFQMEQLQDAMLRATVVQFPTVRNNAPKMESAPIRKRKEA